MNWDEATIKAENFNNRALNALFCGMTNKEFKKISSTEVANKEFKKISSMEIAKEA